MKSSQKKKSQGFLALLLALTMAVSLAVVPAQAVHVDYTKSELPSLEVASEPASTEGATFTNTSGDGGEDWISMTAARNFEAKIPVDMTLDAANDAIENNEISWTLSRTSPYLNEEMYPNYDQGGAMSDWETYRGANLFDNLVTTAEDDDGTVFLKLTFTCNLYYSDSSVPHGYATYAMDEIGWFNLCPVMNENALGTVAVKVYPYDTFLTMGEMYDEIDAIVDSAKGVPGISVQKKSMGTSEAGYDMPYLIIAKDGDVADNWLTLTEEAEADPSAVLSQIESGDLDDVQVPVMFSNVHSNEVSAADSIFQFAKMLVNAQKNSDGQLSYTNLTGFTQAGEEELANEKAANHIATPDLVADTATYLGYLKGSSRISAPQDMGTWYTSENVDLTVNDLLGDVFFILVPEENVEGRAYMTRESSGGFDLNRDNSFQTQKETQNMQHLIGTYNPVSLVELHGRIEQFQCEPCDPPHEPNFEYDLLSKHLMTGGEAFGIAAVANNDSYNSYVIPERDYLTDKGDGTTEWEDPWDDMSTSYTPQYAMLHGTVAYTVECPAYNATVTQALAYGQLGQSAYIAENKLDYLKDQASIFQRGVENQNSDAYDKVGQWFCNVYDVEGAESDIFRPEYDGAGQNGNFYPECYIIPTDAVNQSNLPDAYEMAEYLTRNDVKVNVSTQAFTYNGVSYPAGTLVVSMYQAKRSVANSVLYDGTVITGWPVLYSEGITCFNETRGFDMVTCAEPAAYSIIMSACGTTLDGSSCASYIAANCKSVLTGTVGSQVIISNASEDSTAAVNALLQAGKKVGMITSGEYMGSFICAYKDWTTVASQYVLTGTGIRTNYPEAKVITKAPTLYINGVPSKDGAGYVNATAVADSYEYNYDRQAMDLLNFQTTTSAAKADVVIGAGALDDSAVTAVENGTPYIGYGDTAMTSVAGGYGWQYDPDSGWDIVFIPGKLFDSSAMSVTNVGGSSMDALAYVTYPTTTLVNASYVTEGDDILYGYGANYFSKIPTGASVLVQLDGSKTPLEGFLCADGGHYDDFLNNSVQAIAYSGTDMNSKNVNVVLFANTLTNKVHQRDEFNYISNFVFSNLLGESYFESSSSGSSSSGSSSGGSTGSTVSTAAKLAGDTFSDVSASDWYAEDVGSIYQLGLMKGTTADTFSPDASFTRGMVAAILYRMAGSPSVSGSSSFSDIPDGFWCADAVIWAQNAGVVKGYDDGTFGSADPITREQLVAILYRYAAFAGIDTAASGSLASFSDASSVSGYATDAMMWAVGSGIVQGTDSGALTPKATASRAVSAVLMMRAYHQFNA